MRSASLNHMNGRIYDYQSGRFLSVDPFISMPGSSQAYNPYSYVMNNPLSYTDPTGYFIQDLTTKSQSSGGNQSENNYENKPEECNSSCVDKKARLITQSLCNSGGKCSVIVKDNGAYKKYTTNISIDVGVTPQTPVDNTGPFELGLDFITGEGATNRYFGPGSDISKQFSEGDGAKTFEEFLSSKYDGNPQPGDGVTNFGYKFTWFFRAWTTNSAEHFMGSWKGTAKVMDDMILFRAENTAGTHSLFFGRQIDEANKFLGVTNAPYPHKIFSVPDIKAFDGNRIPLSNMNTTIEWTRRLRQKQEDNL